MIQGKATVSERHCDTAITISSLILMEDLSDFFLLPGVLVLLLVFYMVVEGGSGEFGDLKQKFQWISSP